MSRPVILFILNLLISNNQVCGAKILAVFPSPSISHQMVFRPLTQELAKRGHEVTVITADPAFTQENRPDNLIEIDVHNVSYNLWRETMKEFDIIFGKKNGIYKTLKGLPPLYTFTLDVQLRTKEVQNILNDTNQKYDLLFLESCVRPALMFSHIFKAPIIPISSFGIFQGMKSPLGTSDHIIYPGSMQQRLFNLTFWEKLEEIYKIFWLTQLWHNGAENEQNVLAKYFGNDVPPYSELLQNINMLFINIHPMWSSNPPLPPNIVHIWGIDKKHEKSLPQDLKSYMDSSKNGVIYLSFGSNVRSSHLPREKIQLFINVFSKLPYEILWKWEEDELPRKSKNIKISKWFPQFDLLSHPNLKLFITQGGLQSTQEAINAGVPMVGIPMIGDQWYNVELYEYHRIGISLDFEEITEEALTDAIQTVLNEPSYKENILKLRNLMYDQPEGALQRAVWWSEYVLRHGGAKHLRAAGANLSFVQYYEVEFLVERIFQHHRSANQVVFRPLTQELAKRGHRVTVITPDPVFTKGNSPANLTEIDVHDVSYNLWLETVKGNDLSFGQKDSIFLIMDTLKTFFATIMDAQLQSEEVQSLLNDKTKKYDLILIEALARPTLILTHVYKAPVIQVSSFGLFIGNENAFGIPTHPILYPNTMQQRIFNLTFWEKLYEMYKYYRFSYIWEENADNEHSIIAKRFGGNIPPYKELEKNVDMLFLNVHPMWSHNQPLPPNVISIWGIHQITNKQLPKDLQNYLDSSKNGVIYLSFGSNARSALLPRDKIQLIINVFSKLPFDILWKWEEDDLPGKSENIKISKWLPQSDLLRHPKIKLFITQGGLQSTDEAINAGVPMVGIPMLGDQWYNVELYEYYKIGARLEFEELTEAALSTAIQNVLNDPSYKENIIKLRGLLSDQPEGALQRAVWWSEYVLRHGGAKHLRAAGANLSFMYYYELEFLFKLLLLVSSVLGIVLICIYFLYTKMKTVMRRSKIKMS